MSDQGFYSHPTATIDEGARIGPGTKIWHYSHVCSGASIGESCTLGQNCFIDRNVAIGRGVKIQNNVSVYQGVVVEDYAFLGPSCVFTNVLTPRSASPRNNPAIDYLPTFVRRGASIGANATICCGVELGAWCLIGAGAVVTRDVPAHVVITGVPGRPQGWACHCGAVLRGTGAALNCPDQTCGRRYRLARGSLELESTPTGARRVEGLE